MDAVERKALKRAEERKILEAKEACDKAVAAAATECAAQVSHAKAQQKDKVEEALKERDAAIAAAKAEYKSCDVASANPAVEVL